MIPCFFVIRDFVFWIGVLLFLAGSSIVIPNMLRDYPPEYEYYAKEESKEKSSEKINWGLWFMMVPGLILMCLHTVSGFFTL